MLESDLRQYFPIFHSSDTANPWVYLDSAATSQKPQSVLEQMERFYAMDNANVHRASHNVALRATASFETARANVQGFINAASAKEIIWTKGATESINLLASILARGHFKPGDQILLSTLEHHANIVPWQQVAEQLNLRLRVMPIDENGILDLHQALTLINDNTAMLAIGHVSNALGNINPVEKLIERAKLFGALTLIDGAQAVAHIPIDVQALDCDFYVFSGHKMFGPTGIGVLYGKEALLARLPPYQYGGEMIEHVSFSGTRFQGLPLKYEAGTPNIAGVVGLAAAVDFIVQHRATITQHEGFLYRRLLQELEQVPGIRLWGDLANSTAIQSFTIEGLNNQDLGLLLNEHNFALRVGHHCAMPLMQALGLDEGTLRVSLACYNTGQEIERFVKALNSAIGTLQGNGSAKTPVNKEKHVFDPAQFLPIARQVLQAKGWDETYRQIMLAGKGLNRLAPEDHLPEYEVAGCESQVWLTCATHNGLLSFKADSPSKIVRGLLALMFEVLQNQSIKQVLAFDMPDYLQQLGLAKYLSPSRGNGLQAVLRKIMDYCANSPKQIIGNKVGEYSLPRLP
ncbi:MAG: cysteine desulfurase/selenocysteine lyase [Paraglaciecola sp.]|jgi:cysteine desulfurase/selenocysteine lyase